jgi:hypothetical protein
MAESTFEIWTKTKDDPKYKEMLKQMDDSTRKAAYDLVRISALMKHSAFREEREWRLVVPLLKGFNDNDSSLFFSAASTTLIPRTIQKLRTGSALLTEVVIGPGSHGCSVEAVKQYLTARGETPEVKKSVAPYRRTS